LRTEIKNTNKKDFRLK